MNECKGITECKGDSGCLVPMLFVIAVLIGCPAARRIEQIEERVYSIQQQLDITAQPPEKTDE